MLLSLLVKFRVRGRRCIAHGLLFRGTRESLGTKVSILEVSVSALTLLYASHLLERPLIIGWIRAMLEFCRDLADSMNRNPSSLRHLQTSTFECSNFL